MKDTRTIKNTATAEALLSMVPVLSDHPSAGRSELLSLLELVMTNSSFGFEYAQEKLRSSSVTSLIKIEEMEREIEGHRDAYFEARERMQILDPTRVLALEQRLCLEKQTLFMSAKTTCH